MGADNNLMDIHGFRLTHAPQDFIDDPYPYYAALREHSPVHELETGSYFVSRYEDVVALYRHSGASSDKKVEFKPKFGDSPLYEHHTTSLVFNDPPLHTRVRKIMMGALTPRAISAMEPGLIRLIDSLLDSMEEKGEVDLIEDFAAAIPVEVIGNLFVMPHEERGPLRDWSLAILGALFLEWPLLFVPAQLLWLNLVTKGLQDVALAFEPGESGVLQRPPRSPREGVVSTLLWERSVVVGVVMAAGTMLVFRRVLDATDDLGLAQTVALTTMVVFQMFHVGNSRSEHRSIFQLSPVSNPFLFIATVASLVVHVGALYVPWTQFVLRVQPIELEVWVEIIAVASTILVAVELHKLLRRGSQSRTARQHRRERL